MEWGCMQALIDFDGWRKWKDFSANAANQSNSNNNEDKEKKTLAKKKKNRISIGSSSGATSTLRPSGLDERVEQGGDA
jgi:osomolarity two-component system response regulator SSK1